MSGLVTLLLAAGASAYGAWASLRSRLPLAASALVAALFALAGLAAVLASWILGDGVVLPGRQLSPGLVAYYASELPLPVLRWLILLAPLAHVLLLVLKRDGASLLRPLPATAALVWLFLGIGAAGRTGFVQAAGPGQVAYLTIAEREGGTRLILAAGDPLATFLEVLHVHETKGVPPEIHVHWTNDGKAVALRLHEQKDPVFLVDLGGSTTGALPSEPREWPASGEFVQPDVGRRFSLARKEVSEVIRAHGGLAP